MNYLPNLVSVSELQKNYSEIFKNLISENPLFVLNNNKPQAVILSPKFYQQMAKKMQRMEEEDALESIEIYKQEAKAGKLKKLENIDELFD